jgi:DNA primase
MSNRITETQVEKITRWSRQIGNNRVTLMFDCDVAGEEGAKEALWLLAQQRLDVRLVWSQKMHGVEFDGKQPELIVAADVEILLH